MLLGHTIGPKKALRYFFRCSNNTRLRGQAIEYSQPQTSVAEMALNLALQRDFNSRQSIKPTSIVAKDEVLSSTSIRSNSIPSDIERLVRIELAQPLYESGVIPLGNQCLNIQWNRWG